MEINRNDLLNAMGKALPGVETGNTILEGADTFIFKDNYIHSYNDNISITVPFNLDNSLQGSIKARDFYDLINRFKSDTIKIIQKENKWIIKNKSARAELILLENNIFEHIEKLIPNKPKWNKLPEKFFDAINICLFSSSKSSLSGIFLNEDIMISTDEIRINWFKLDSVIKEQFWISDEVTKELIKLPNITNYFIDNSWVHFQSEDGTIFSCKKLQSDLFPYTTIERIVSENKKEKNDIKGTLPKNLWDAINRASALSMNIELFNSIKLIFTNDYIEVYSERSSGKYSEKVKWDEPIKNIPNISILIDYTFLEQGLKFSNNFYLKCKDKEPSKIVFIHNDGVQIVNTFEDDEE
ncbi:MAG: hypothetical protein PHF86_08515 [Candidatus Nanoarchaeia archaeon]|jgi:DNA polymerase III sliding clamp (beta) subunit (PCNA family)|nr:hypothetical protein [Candidatus Nanoarchaeia archaeon]